MVTTQTAPPELFRVKFYDRKLSKKGRGVQVRTFTDRGAAEAFAAVNVLYSEPCKVETVAQELPESFSEKQRGAFIKAHEQGLHPFFDVGSATVSSLKKLGLIARPEGSELYRTTEFGTRVVKERF